MYGFRRRLRFGLVLGAVLTVTGIGAASASAQGTFSCRASALRVGGLPPLLSATEPVVANPADSPCTTDRAYALSPVILPLTADVLDASTTANANGASAYSDGSAVCLGGTVPIFGTCYGIGATVLSSNASASCPASGTTPAFAGHSALVDLTINGTHYPIANRRIYVAFLGRTVQIYVNRQIRTQNSLTQRALEVDLGGSPLLVVGEATADTTGNPCSHGV